MYSFESDYTLGCHPLILENLLKTNMEETCGYGHDRFCESAEEKIRQVLLCPHAQIQFIAGGTQTNQIVIDTMLKSWQAVVAADTGHIACHEAGAVEFSGHKVLNIPSYEGKIKACDLECFCHKFFADENREHMVYPGMVYVSLPTEFGTVYTKNELEDISAVCKKYDLIFYVDGARLGYAIECEECDLTLAELAEICDVFYIGGTKVGALLGEAVVFTKNNMPEHFENLVKKHGALLAKGRILGIGFDTLFTDNLYFKLSRHAVEMAVKVRQIFENAGIPLYIASPTNQQFVFIEDERLEKIGKSVRYCFWEKPDSLHTVARFATSWGTTEQALLALEKAVMESAAFQTNGDFKNF